MINMNEETLKIVSTKLVGQTVNKNGVDGKIVKVLGFSNTVDFGDISIEVDFNNSLKQLILFKALEHGMTISTEVDDLKSLVDAVTAQRLEEKSNYEKEQEELYQKAKAEREAQKAQERQSKLLQRKLTNLYNLGYDVFSETTDTYKALGWLAKHTNSIVATIPEYADKWFNKTFGDMEHTVVPNDKKTSGGYAMKFNVSFSLSTNATSEFALLNKVLKNKKINNTQFIFTLVDRYGFTFGKSAQNIDEIKSNIPNEYVVDFEKGLAL